MIETPLETSPATSVGVYFINSLLDLCGISSTQNQQDEEEEIQ